MRRNETGGRALWDTGLLGEAAQRLCDWFSAQGRRDLPWRRDASPYHVWLSEIMLQQTRIGAVIPYYNRFVRVFPTVQSLAAAREEEVFKCWEGLGYYSRARNLMRAAQIIVTQYGARFPGTAAEWERLPGVGAYTAGAVASIAFGEPSPAVDGNVLRVCARLCACDADIALPATRSAVHDALRVVYERGERAAALTQGWMELGQRVCLPGDGARCAECPLSGICRARAGGLVGLLPAKSPRAPRRTEQHTVLLLYDGAGRVALRRRPPTGLLGGLFCFPSVEGRADCAAACAAARALGFSAETAYALPDARHVFTHIEWQMCAYALPVGDTVPDGFVMVSRDTLERDYALPRAFRVYREIFMRDALQKEKEPVARTIPAPVSVPASAVAPVSERAGDEKK